MDTGPSQIGMLAMCCVPPVAYAWVVDERGTGYCHAGAGSCMSGKVLDSTPQASQAALKGPHSSARITQIATTAEIMCMAVVCPHTINTWSGHA